MSVRLVRAEDVESLVRLESEALGADAWSEAMLRSELEEDTRFAVLAEDSDRVLGYGVLMVVADTADVQRVAVAADGRRRGVGRIVLGALLDEAERRGCRSILLEVRADNSAAIALYTAGGFVRIAARRGYYADGADALVLSRTGPASHA